MSLSRPSLSPSAPSFGRRTWGFVQRTTPRATSEINPDARLFALTFLGGFLFMMVYLA